MLFCTNEPINCKIFYCSPLDHLSKKIFCSSVDVPSSLYIHRPFLIQRLTVITLLKSQSSSSLPTTDPAATWKGLFGGKSAKLDAPAALAGDSAVSPIPSRKATTVGMRPMGDLSSHGTPHRELSKRERRDCDVIGTYMALNFLA